MQFHKLYFCLHPSFYPRTFSINKQSWGQRSNQACPLERKSLWFLVYFCKIFRDSQSFFLNDLLKKSKPSHCKEMIYSLYENVLLVSFLLLQTGQVHHNLQKSRPVPGPLSTQQPLANRQWYILESQHEEVKPIMRCLASSPRYQEMVTMIMTDILLLSPTTLYFKCDL